MNIFIQNCFQQSDLTQSPGVHLERKVEQAFYVFPTKRLNPVAGSSSEFSSTNQAVAIVSNKAT